MQQLSPDKYILTKARSLPIDKCMVNQDWEESRMANVVICRRHVTGNLTVGFYLVDLMCLGVKDSFYFFNITPEELEERVPIEKGLEIISYELAHNIVYAGYEFAIEFEIKPCREFNLTQYILEEDDERVPLLDIPTGGKDGLPHLMAQSGAVFSDALAKLRLHAGEGNFYYTLADDLMDDDEEDEEDEEDLELDLEDIPSGEVTAHVAKRLSTVSIMNKALYEKRNPMEKIVMDVEICWRLLKADEQWGGHIIDEDDLYELPEYALLDQSEDGLHTENGFLPWDGVDEDKAIEQKTNELLGLPVEDLAGALGQLPTEIQDDPLFAIHLYEMINMSPTHSDHIDMALLFLGRHAATCPLAALYLHLDAYLKNANTLENPAARSNAITDLLPGYTFYGNFELHVYWLIQLLRYIHEDDLGKVSLFYQFAIDAQGLSPKLTMVQFLLSQYLLKKVQSADGLQNDS